MEALEAGRASLEDSLKLYERGVFLVRMCHGRLDQAERHIECLNGEIPRDLL